MGFIELQNRESILRFLTSYILTTPLFSTVSETSTPFLRHFTLWAGRFQVETMAVHGVFADDVVHDSGLEHGPHGNVRLPDG